MAGVLNAKCRQSVKCKALNPGGLRDTLPHRSIPMNTQAQPSLTNHGGVRKRVSTQWDLRDWTRYRGTHSLGDARVCCIEALKHTDRDNRFVDGRVREISNYWERGTQVNMQAF